MQSCTDEDTQTTWPKGFLSLKAICRKWHVPARLSIPSSSPDLLFVCGNEIPKLKVVSCLKRSSLLLRKNNKNKVSLSLIYSSPGIKHPCRLHTCAAALSRAPHKFVPVLGMNHRLCYSENWWNTLGFRPDRQIMSRLNSFKKDSDLLQSCSGFFFLVQIHPFDLINNRYADTNVTRSYF